MCRIVSVFVHTSDLTFQSIISFRSKMALCVPKVMILGHSFVRRLSGDSENHFDDRAKSNFNLEDVKVRLFGVGRLRKLSNLT